jgi:hypothetical protein
MARWDCDSEQTQIHWIARLDNCISCEQVRPQLIPDLGSRKVVVVVRAEIFVQAFQTIRLAPYLSPYRTEHQESLHAPKIADPPRRELFVPFLDPINHRVGITKFFFLQLFVVGTFFGDKLLPQLFPRFEHSDVSGIPLCKDFR